MQSIRLDIQDHIFDKIMYLLNNLPKKDVKISIETIKNPEKLKKLTAISLKTKGYKFDRSEANER